MTDIQREFLEFSDELYKLQMALLKYKDMRIMERFYGIKII